jgi:copper chaperone CopZ
MKSKPDAADSTLNETMTARIEIKELGDPALQKKITGAVEALDGVIETKIENDALHVSFDPLATTEKKIEQAVRSAGTNIKAAAVDRENPHPEMPTSSNVAQTRVKKTETANTPDHQATADGKSSNGHPRPQGRQ